LNTVPLDLSERPAQFADGANGLAAGNITLFAMKVIGGAADAKRIVVRGGSGQPAGLGQQGAAGKSLPTYGLGNETWVKPSPGFGDYRPPKPGDPTYPKKAVYHYAKGLQRDDEQGTRAWPGDGEDSKPGGKPGDGGSSGIVTSNFDLRNFADLAGGNLVPQHTRFCG
jgi:hypothetical protein